MRISEALARTNSRVWFDAMKEAVFARIHAMFDVPNMQNNVRAYWVEAMVCELLGEGWSYTGGDWAGWDLERHDGLRVEVKQSARFQSWGESTAPARFKIGAVKGYYPDGKTYRLNDTGARLADVYIFAWHDGWDQREIEQWRFYVVDADRLPVGQKSLGLTAVQKCFKGVPPQMLRDEVSRAGRLSRSETY